MPTNAQLFSTPISLRRRFCGPSGLNLTPLLAGAFLVASTVGQANAQEAMNLTMAGGGHGLLFDGAARAQAGVPDGVAEAIWGMQEQLTAWRSQFKIKHLV